MIQRLIYVDDKIRTCDLQSRSLMRYPATLRPQTKLIVLVLSFSVNKQHQKYGITAAAFGILP